MGGEGALVPLFSLWKAVWRVLKKRKLALPFDTAVFGGKLVESGGKRRG